MAGEWVKVTLENVAAQEKTAIAIGPFGSRMKKDCYRGSGVPVLRGNNITDTRELKDEFVFIEETKADELATAIAYPDDLYFPHRGAIGRVGIVPHKGYARYVLSTAMMKITLDKSLVDPMFVYYFFRSEEGRSEILMNESTVGTPGIGQPLSSMRKFRLPLPPLDVQHAIAHILGTLDDKIELNRRMNETLEAMARALFKSWFVDFDPVRAKMEGRWKRGESLPGMPAHLWELFPDKLVDSELGEIPEGWEVKSIEDLCVKIENGSTPKRIKPCYWGGSIPWFKTGELADGPLLDSEEKITETGLCKSSCKLWPAGTVLMALYASPTVGRLGILEIAAASNQACSALIAKPDYGHQFLFFSLLFSRDRLQQIAVGAAQQNISQKVVRNHTIIVPSVSIAKLFQERTEILYRRRVRLGVEVNTLSMLRDTLLPKLISGEVRVEDACSILERIL